MKAAGSDPTAHTADLQDSTVAYRAAIIGGPVGRSCFYCGQSVTGYPCGIWAGFGATIFLHVSCMAALGLRLQADAHPDTQARP